VCSSQTLCGQCLQDDTLFQVALPSAQEHAHAQPALVGTLQLVAALLQNGRVKCSMSMRARIVKAATAVDLFGLLLNSVLANCSMMAASRNAAAACLCEVLGICEALVAFTHCIPSDEHDQELQDTLQSSLSALELPLCTLLQYIVRQVGMPTQQTEQNSCPNRHLLRIGMSMLMSICRILPGAAWSRCGPCERVSKYACA
jgi:hypothetical protein